jgi:hypothetical protein
MIAPTVAAVLILSQRMVRRLRAVHECSDSEQIFSLQETVVSNDAINDTRSRNVARYSRSKNSAIAARPFHWR